MMNLYWLVLAMMTSLSPAQDPVMRHGRLATAIAVVASEEAPLFKNDEDRVRTVALLVAVAFRESSLQHDAVGDSGRSVCAMQIHGGNKSLLVDTPACVRTGLSMLQESIRVDRDEPVAFYARGPRYKSDEARSLSRDRVRLSQRLAKEAPANTLH
jgi:hypothetical protein